jgi:hypothetical protein
MTTIKTASPRISHDWTCFGKRPGGFGVFSSMGSFIVSLPSVGYWRGYGRRKNVIFFLPMARYPESRTFGTM